MSLSDTYPDNVVTLCMYFWRHIWTFKCDYVVTMSPKKHAHSYIKLHWCVMSRHCPNMRMPGTTAVQQHPDFCNTWSWSWGCLPDIPWDGGVLHIEWIQLMHRTGPAVTLQMQYRIKPIYLLTEISQRGSYRSSGAVLGLRMTFWVIGYSACSWGK